MPRHPPCTLNSLTTNIQISPVDYLLCEKQTTFRGEPFIWVWPWLHDQQIKPNIIQITISICEVFRLHVRATVGKDSYSPHSSFNMLKSVNFSTTHSRVVFLIVWNWSKLSLTTRLQSLEPAAVQRTTTRQAYRQLSKQSLDVCLQLQIPAKKSSASNILMPSYLQLNCQRTFIRLGSLTDSNYSDESELKLRVIATRAQKYRNCDHHQLHIPNGQTPIGRS